MKRFLFLAVLTALSACTQADEDQYKATGPQPVYGESNGLFYDATNDRLSLFINDVEVGYLTAAGNLVLDGTTTVGGYALADDIFTVYGTGSDSPIGFDHTVQAPDSLIVGVGSESNQIIIGEVADLYGAGAVDLTLAQQLNPTVVIRSATATDANDYMTLAMDGTNGVIGVGEGQVSVPAGITTAATTGAITFTGTNATIVVKDNTAATLNIGSTGAVDLISIDTGNDSEEVIITGFAATDAFSVAAGNVSFDQDFRVDGDTTLSGGAGSITFDTGDESIVVKDADTTALIIGANGALNILGIDTTDVNPMVDITGINGQTALHVDVGSLLCDEPSTFTGDASFNGGAGAITLSGSGDSSIVLADKDTTAFVVGADGALNILGIDTTDANPMVDITGINGQTALHVDVGSLVCDEPSTFTGDMSVNGGAGAITTTASGDSTIVATDADATAFCMGADGALDLVCLDTENASPAWRVKGVAAAESFHVDAGTSQFDEDITIGAGAAGIDYVINANGETNDGVITYMEDEDDWKFADDIDANGDIFAGGGAGALTFDAASSSMVCTDNSATGLVIGATDALTMMTLDTRDGAENVTFGNGQIRSILYSNAASNVTLDLGDCGKVQFMGATMDGSTYTLPAATAGCEMQFVYKGADHGALLDISPQAADAIHGTCVEMTADSAIEFNGTDDNDIGCSKATCNTGDGITLMSDGVEGWYVTACNGIWANN